jgi:diacylglycerol kinase (ATP)
MSLKKRVQSFGFAIKGLKTLFVTQANARVHALAIVVVTALGFYFNINKSEWCGVVLAFALVLSAEALNTAIEFVVDLVSPQYHPLAGKAKDVAAAAVLITAMGAVIVGLIIFLPKILIFFQK